MNQIFFFFLTLLTYPEILKDFNFRKIYRFKGKEIPGAVLCSLNLQRLFFFFYNVISLMTSSFSLMIVFFPPCHSTYNKNDLCR